MSEQVTEVAQSMVVKAQRALDYSCAGVSDNTRRAYASDARHLAAWCEEHGVELELPLDPVSVGAYLASLADAGYALATIERRIAAISALHRSAGIETPTAHAHVRAVWRGVRRTIDARKDRPSPLVFSELVGMLSHMGDGLIDLRDRALLLVSWAAALRRSEAVALELGDIERRDEGIVLCLRRSKTDQEGNGRRVGVRGRAHSLCPVAALDLWISKAQIEKGHVFRRMDRHGNVYDVGLRPRQVNTILKQRVEAAGMNPEDYSGHSLRSGLVVSARARGASEQSIMRVTGHRTIAGLSHYLAVGSDFLEDPAGCAGLA